MSKQSLPTNPPPNPMNRRAFMARSATAVPFAIMAPRLALGSEANSRITVGCVAVGSRGGWIARALRKHGGYQITAMADYHENRVKDLGDKLDVPKANRFSGLSGYKGVLGTKPDAVFLETPPYFFPKHATAAVEAGCHVFMAKNPAVDVPGCKMIAEAGKRSTANGKVFLIDFQTRTDPYHIEAIKRVHEGILGKIGLISTFYYDQSFEDPPKEATIENLLTKLRWVNDVTLGGAYIANCDIHAIDVGLWVANDVPESAVGHSVRNRKDPHHDTHDMFSVSYAFKNGMIMNNHSEHVANGHGFKSECHAFGQDAFLEARYGGKTWIHGKRNAYKGGENKNLYGEGMLANVDTFHKSVTEGIHDNPTVAPSVNATLTAILGREAALQGRKITWDELLQDTTRLEADLTGLKV